jgi:hypothetical protein
LIFLCDLDGTVCDIEHRLHFIGATPTSYVPFKDTKDWSAFHNACVDDKPIWPVITVVRALEKAGHKIVYSTGRGDDSRVLTLGWLKKYRVPVLDSTQGLYMRQHGDHRDDFIVKGELLDKILKDYNVRVEDLGGAFEDRQQVVTMYRNRGLKVFQVAPGNF